MDSPDTLLLAERYVPQSKEDISLTASFGVAPHAPVPKETTRVSKSSSDPAVFPITDVTSETSSTRKSPPSSASPSTNASPSKSATATASTRATPISTPASTSVQTPASTTQTIASEIPNSIATPNSRLSKTSTIPITVPVAFIAAVLVFAWYLFWRRIRQRRARMVFEPLKHGSRVDSLSWFRPER